MPALLCGIVVTCAVCEQRHNCKQPPCGHCRFVFDPGQVVHKDKKMVSVFDPGRIVHNIDVARLALILEGLNMAKRPSANREGQEKRKGGKEKNRYVPYTTCTYLR